MPKNATADLAHDLRNVGDDLKEIVETVVAPRVTSAARAAAERGSTAVQAAAERGSTAVHAAAERVPGAVQAATDRVPDAVLDRLPDRVTDRLPVEKSHRGRKLLLLGALLALGAVVFSKLRGARSGSAPAHAAGSATPTPSYPRPVEEPEALTDPVPDPAEPPLGGRLD